MKMAFKLVLISFDSKNASGDVALEIAALKELYDQGLQHFHIRKPFWQKDELRRYLDSLGDGLRKICRLHSFFELSEQYDLGGIHLSKDRKPFGGYSGNMSYSAHSEEDLQECWREYQTKVDYAFLSPIFDSVSKKGYESRFSTREIEDYKNRGVINSKVVALGGVKAENIGSLVSMGFGGAAVLGYIWNEFLEDKNIRSLKDRWKRLQNYQDCSL